MLPTNDRADGSPLEEEVSGQGGWNSITLNCWDDVHTTSDDTVNDQCALDDDSGNDTAAGARGNVAQRQLGRNQDALAPRDTHPPNPIVSQLRQHPNPSEAPGSAGELQDSSPLNGWSFRGRAPRDNSTIANSSLASAERIQTAIGQVDIQTQGAINKLLLRLLNGDGARRAARELQQYGDLIVPFLIRDLGSNDFRIREIARTQLHQLGPAAIPALFAEVDNPSSLESRQRAMQVIGQILQQHGQTAAYDGAGRLRVLYNPATRQNIFEASYDGNGTLTSVSIGNLHFHRRANGAYSEQNSEQAYTSLTVDQFGNVRFGSGQTALMVTPDGRQFFYQDNRLERIQLANGSNRLFNYDANGQLISTVVINRPRGGG